MFYLSLFLYFMAAVQNDVLVLKNGKTMPCDTYSVANNRVTIEYKGESYSIPEKLVDWAASEKVKVSRMKAEAEKERRAKEAAQKAAEPDEDKQFSPEKRDPIFLTNKNLKPKAHVERTESVFEKKIGQNGHESRLQRITTKLELAMDLINENGGFTMDPLTDDVRHRLMNHLRQAGSEFQQAKQMVRHDRSELQKKLNADFSHPDQEKLAQMSVNISCNLQLEHFIDVFKTYTVMVIQTYADKDTSFEREEKNLRQLMVAIKILPAINECYSSMGLMNK